MARALRANAIGSRAVLLLTFSGAAVAAISVLVVRPDHAYPAVLASASAIFLVQAFLPACRPRLERSLSPYNWALAAFACQLLLLPLLIMWGEPSQGTLPALPRQESINYAILISALSYVAFSCGYCLGPKRTGDVRVCFGSSEGVNDVSLRLVLLFALLGGTGVVLKFGSITGLRQYYADLAAWRASSTGGSVTLGQAASTFLRPFLVVTPVLWWCRQLRNGPAQSASVKGLHVSICLMGVLAAGSTNDLNRGSFVVPVVAMAGVYSLWQKRISAWTLALSGTAALSLLFLLGSYRTGKYTLDAVLHDPGTRQEIGRRTSTLDELQVYAAAPQFTAFAIENAAASGKFYSGSTLVSSLMYPIPIFGKLFRETSGVRIYNRMIYGDQGVFDQIIPFQAELYMNLGLPGILAGYFLLGALFGVIERRFQRSSTPFESYTWLYSGVWLTFLVQGSLAVLAQILVYDSWPFLLYFCLRRRVNDARIGNASDDAHQLSPRSEGGRVVSDRPQLPNSPQAQT